MGWKLPVTLPKDWPPQQRGEARIQYWKMYFKETASWNPSPVEVRGSFDQQISTWFV